MTSTLQPLVDRDLTARGLSETYRYAVAAVDSVRDGGGPVSYPLPDFVDVYAVRQALAQMLVSIASRKEVQAAAGALFEVSLLDLRVPATLAEVARSHFDDTVGCQRYLGHDLASGTGTGHRCLLVDR